MSKRYQTIAYALVFIALFCFLIGWKILVAPERLEDVAEYQKRITITAANVSAPSTEGTDESLKIYAVNVVHTPPFKNRFIANGIYLGEGVVLTAAHVVGRWSSYGHPRVLIGGQDLRAAVLKHGSPEHTDLALLSVDEGQLPVSLRLRRNPLCKEPLQVGMNVVVVYPERTVDSHIISPLLIPSESRSRFPTLIESAQGSGSGVFNAEKKCLIGIMSAQVKKLAYQGVNGRTIIKDDGYAGYFVPVSKGATFIPQQYRY